MSDGDSIAAAARRCIAMSSGTCEEYIRDDVGNVASVALAKFDCSRRLVESQRRFVLADQEANSQDGALNLISASITDETDWVSSFADVANLYVRQPDGLWFATPAPWPAGGPTAQLYWLLGARDCEREQLIGDNSFKIRFDTSFREIMCAQERDLQGGVQCSLDSAGADRQTRIEGTARIDGGLIRVVHITLNDREPLSSTTDFANWGVQQDIPIPEHAIDASPESMEEVFDRLTGDQDDHK